MNRKSRRLLDKKSSLEGELERTLKDMQTGNQVLQPVNTDAVDAILKPEGEIIPVSYKDLEQFPHSALRVWMHRNGVYQIITTELIDFLRPLKELGQCVEVVAGVGTLGKALGITCVDSHLQDRPDMKAHYEQMKQPTIKYGAHVVKMDATEWVKENRPEVVIASWLTEKRRGGFSIGAIEGPDEGVIQGIANVYVHIGTLAQHSQKPILKLKHHETRAPWLISRSADQSLNRIWVFGDLNGLME